MGKNNYLDVGIELVKHKEPINCQITTNYDEEYASIYPPLSSCELVQKNAKYPDHNYGQLSEKVCSKLNLKNIIWGAGSEDIIIRANAYAKEKHWKVGMVLPIFYRTIDSYCGKSPVCIDEKDLLDYNYSTLDMVWINQPNLFTGSTYQRSDLIGLIGRHPNTMFLIDEAGIFSILGWEQYSLLGHLGKTKNAVVLSSISKMSGLAGMRVGFATGNEEFLNELKSRGTTFPLTSLSEYYATIFIDNFEKLSYFRQKIEKNKKLISDALKKISGVSTLDSSTNCIYIRSTSPSFYDRLLKVGIIGLNLNNQPAMPERGLVRVTVPGSCVLSTKIISRIKGIAGAE